MDILEFILLGGAILYFGAKFFLTSKRKDDDHFLGI